MRLEDHLGTITVGATPPTVSARATISRLQADGLGPSAIAHRLNVAGVPTPSGRGRWWSQTVQRHVDPAPWAARMRYYRALARDPAVRRG